MNPNLPGGGATLNQKPLDTGRLRLGAVVIGSWARATHEGRPGDGLPNTEHRIDAGWGQLNLAAQLGIVERFGVDVALPLRLTALKVSSFAADGRSLATGDTVHRDQTVFSPGDLLTSLRFGVIRDEDVRGWTLDVRFGATLPTGRVRPDPFHPDNDEPVERLSHGSGTIDPWFGVESFYNVGRWGLTTFASSRVPVVTNRYGNRASRVLQAGAGVATGFGLIKWRFLFQPEVFVASPVQWRDREAPTTGRVSLLAAAGVFYQPRPRFNLNAKLSVPYYTRTRDGDFLWPFIVLAGINYTFELIPEGEHKH